MDSTAIGMDADTVSPARSARYTVDAPKITPRIAPRMMARTVNSGMIVLSDTNGWNGLLSAGALMALVRCRVGLAESEAQSCSPEQQETLKDL